jgi:hypothetical protein
MVVLMGEGVDVVCGRRGRRAGDGMLGWATGVFYRVVGRRVTDVEISWDVGVSRVITGGVLGVLVAMPKRHRFVSGLVSVLVGWVMALIGGVVVSYSLPGAPQGHPVLFCSALMAGIGLLIGALLFGAMEGGRGERSVAVDELSGVLFPSPAWVFSWAGWR